MKNIIKNISILSVTVLISLKSFGLEDSVISSEQLPTDTCQAGTPTKPAPCFDGGSFAGSAGNTQGFRNYGVKQFYALNWPLLEGSDGVPNLKKIPSGDFISVWQSWETLNEIKDIKSPTLPHDYNKFISSHPEVPYGGHIEFLKQTSIPTNKELKLIDQNKKPIYFQIYLNDTAHSDIKKNKENTNINFTVGRDVSIRGAMFLKAAWQILTDVNTNEANMYHRSFACISQIDGNQSACKMEVVGLVGLHIANKMNPVSNFKLKDCTAKKNKDNCLNYNTLPWSWSSFEFVYNAPVIRNINDLNEVNTDIPWVLYDTQAAVKTEIKTNCFTNSSTLNLTNADCILNKGVTKAPAAQIIRFMSEDRNYKPENLTFDICDGKSNTLSELDYSTCNVITSYTKEMKSIWANYRLIDVEWVDDIGAINPIYSSNQPIETIIRNTSMEPYDSQITNDNSGCISCHREASTDAIFSIKSLLKQ